MTEGDDGFYVVRSALKHGVSRDDLVHAYNNFIDVFVQDDGVVMYIGPAHNGALIEVGVLSASDRPELTVVVHGFKPARDKYLRLPDQPRRRRQR